MVSTGEVDMLDPKFEQKLKQIFDRYDDDGSGEIDASELGMIFAALGQPMSDDEVEKLVKEIDEDESGMIEFPEFLKMVSSKESSGLQMLRDQALGELDAEERYSWMRGKILRFKNGAHAPYYYQTEVNGFFLSFFFLFFSYIFPSGF